MLQEVYDREDLRVAALAEAHDGGVGTTGQ